MLASAQLPVQQKVAEELGVAQSLVSRARNRRLRRVTPKVRLLIDYATSRIDAEELATIAARALEADADAAKVAASRTEPARSSPSDGRFRKQAIEGVKAYIADGFDPRLIVEQIAVLRRAQRVRRPGRRVGEDD